LYVSSNGGTAWTQRRSGAAWSVAIAPGPVATAEMLAGTAAGIFRSADGGATWTAVAITGAPATFIRLAVAIAPSNPSVAYAFGAGAPMIRIPGDPDPTHLMPTPYLWRRTAAGGAFTAIATPPGLITTQSLYDWFLAASPDRDNQVYVGAIDCYRADLSGTNWTWTAGSSSEVWGFDPPDQHAIAFSRAIRTRSTSAVTAACTATQPRRELTHCNNGLVSPRWSIAGLGRPLHRRRHYRQQHGRATGSSI
jgi:hypothetical protein